MAGFDVEEFVRGRGDKARPAQKIKVRMADQLRALEMLGKHLGMFKDRVEFSTDNDVIARLLAGKKRVNGMEQQEHGGTA
jgi:hypothetical protein